MTNYETYYPGIEDKDKLAEKLESLCEASKTCAWCFAHKDENCAAGRFREWLDEPRKRKSGCAACQIK